MGERGDEVEGEGRGLAALVVRLGRAAGGRWIAPLLALFALVLHAPTLGGGLFSDDIPQQAFLRKVVEGREAGPWWGLFSLVDLAPETIAGRRLSGLLPWWTADEVRVVFFRPLAVADHLIDAALWPRSPALMHLHSLLLFALLCALVLRLHRRLAGGRPRGALVALIAALSFTVDSTHGAPVAWIAQRNALLAAIFAVACLLAHDRWRRGGARAGPLAALVFLACALLSAELGVSTIALLVAYGLALDPAGWRRGLWATLPAGALAILWLALYGALGFGARACGAYVDPIHSPAIFLGLLPERLAALVMMDLGPSQAIHLAFEAWPLRVAAQALAWAAAAIVIGVVVARLRGDHYLRFATIAFALALAPIASSIPGDRLLLIASVASSAMIAGTIVALAGDRRRLARVAAALVAIVHLVLAPIALVASFEPITRYVFGAPIDAVGRELAEPQALAHQSLIVVHAPSVLHGLQLPGYRALAGLGAPAFTHVLGSGPGPALVTRTGPRALELREPAGFLVDPTASFYRGVDVPLRTGDTVATLAYRAEVIEVDGAGRPTLVRFEFTRKLEHPSLRLVAWDGRDYVDLAPPAIGEAIRLP